MWMFTFGVFICFALTTGLSAEDGGKRESRIVGGNFAKVGQFPYQALILAGQRYCGGSVISKRAILSAAHCFEEVTEDQVQVYLGCVKFLKGDRYSVDKIVRHENYSHEANDIRNDIAVLLLKSDIEFKENIQKIDLATSEIEDVDAIVTGWGLQDILGLIRPVTLKYFTAETISLGKCQQEYRSTTVNVNENVICTESNLWNGICAGDYGGPLVSNGKQIGIVSFLLPQSGCISSYPRVYTKVSSYVDWINNYTKE